MQFFAKYMKNDLQKRKNPPLGFPGPEKPASPPGGNNASANGNGPQWK